MAGDFADTVPAWLFGTGKGSGAALLFFVIGLAGVAVCLIFRRNKHIRSFGRYLEQGKGRDGAGQR